MNNHYSDAGDFRNGDTRHKGRDNDDSTVSQTKCLSAEQLETSRVWGERVGLQMQKGNEAAAFDLVRRGIAAMHGDDSESPLEVPLQALGIDELVLNVLDKRFNALTIGDLLQLDYAAVTAVPGLGPVRTVGLLVKLAAFAMTGWIEAVRTHK